MTAREMSQREYERQERWADNGARHLPRRPLRDWRPTGWNGAFCIRAELQLPGAAELVCYRDPDSKRWRFRMGEYDRRVANIGKSYARLGEAKLAAEEALASQLARGLRVLNREKEL